MTPQDLFDVNGRRTLVTGAASGIGRAVAEAMAEAGARVFFADLDLSGAEAVASGLRGRGLDARAIHIDLADRASINEAVDAAARETGGLDVVFANAGISAGPSPLAAPEGRMEAVQSEAFDRAVAINLTGTFETVRAAARHMTDGGRIVVTASVSGMRASPVSGYAYVAAKAGLINIVRQAAVELGPRGITVNAVAPGFIVTNLAGGILGRDANLAARLSAMVPLGRVGRPEEFRGVALFLASSASDYITGAVIPVDGGYMAT